MVVVVVVVVAVEVKFFIRFVATLWSVTKTAEAPVQRDKKENIEEHSPIDKKSKAI